MRVAVVGAGSIARTIYLPILVDSDCVLDGVTSRSGESAAALARRFNIPRVYGSLDEVEADCAFVLTPTETHAEIASWASTVGTRPRTWR
jgi:predicted dehydrogenase